MKKSCGAVQMEAGDASEIGNYNEFYNNVSNVGVKISVDNVVKYFALDSWIKNSEKDIYIGSNVGGEKGKVESKMYHSYPVWVRNTDQFPSRFYIIPDLLELPSDYSVILRQYQKGILIYSGVEYSFQTLSQSMLKDLSLKNSNIPIGRYEADGISYIYDIYSPIEVKTEGEVPVHLNGGSIQRAGKAYKTDTGYYLAALPTASLVKTGYQTSFLGWYDKLAGGRKYEAGDTLPKDACLYAHWKEIPLEYKVKCIDILGEDSTGKVLGTSSWMANYGTTVYGSKAGKDTANSAYYTGYKYKSCSNSIVGVSGTTVYRYFSYGLYDVKYIDQIESGTRKGEILQTIVKKKEFTSKVAGEDLGNSTQAGEYYEGYCFNRSTKSTVSTDGAIVYRYFIPAKYTILFDGNGAANGSMMCIADCEYDKDITLTQNCFQKENRILFHLNAEGASCNTSEIYITQRFLGWSLEKNGSVRYSDGMTCRNITAKEGIVTLYAIWSEEKVDITNVPKRMGYQFAGWAKTADADTGVTQYTVNSDMELYAVWKPDIVKYQVEYYKENLSGTYELVSSYPLEGYTDSMAKLELNTDVYQGFTLEEASSKLSGMIQANGGLILCAYYRRNSYELSYDNNGGTPLGESLEDEGRKEKYGADVVLSARKLTRKGYIFKGWCQDPNGNHTIFQPGDHYTMQNHDVTLYAVWSPIHYNIHFEANADMADIQGSMSDIKADYSGNIKVENCGFARKGYEFDSWNTKADGSGRSFKTGEALERLSSVEGEKVILYAQWKPVEFCVTYDKNNSVGLVSTISGIVPDTEYTFDKDSFASDITYKAIGYEVEYWSTKADGNGALFKPGENIKGKLVSKDQARLYAIWKPNSHTEFRLHLELMDKTGTEDSTVIELILYGKTGEKISDAVRRIYKETLQDEDTKYFYEGYEVQNADEMQQIIQGDSGTEVDLKMQKRTCNLSYQIYKENQFCQIASASAIYAENVTLPESILDMEMVRYIDQYNKIYYPGDVIKVSRNLNLYLQQSVVFYGSSDQFSDKAEFVVYGKSVKLPEIEKKGYQFLGWYTKEGEYAGDARQIIYHVTKNSEYFAKWSDPLSYKIFYDIDDSRIKILENKVDSYRYMEEINLPDASQIVVDDNYKFAGWYFSGDSEQNIITNIKAGEIGDKTIKALLIKKAPSQNTDITVSEKTEDTDSDNTVINNIRKENNVNLNAQNERNNVTKKIRLKENSNVAESMVGKVFWQGNLKYKILSAQPKKKYVKIIAVKAKAKHIVIPNKVVFQKSSYKVIRIGRKAFYKKNNIVSVIVSDSVEVIEKYAFANMKKLKKIYLGKKVLKVGKCVFAGDKKLEKVVIKSKRVKQIGKKAFFHTKKAIRFVVPGSKTKKYYKLIKLSRMNVKFKTILL